MQGEGTSVAENYVVVEAPLIETAKNHCKKKLFVINPTLISLWRMLLEWR